MPNVHCKISGVTTEADHKNWTREQLKPYIAHTIETFGFDRIMYGGDWHVSELAGTYPQWVEIVDWVIEGASAEEKRKLFRDNAISFYRLDQRRMTAPPPAWQRRAYSIDAHARAGARGTAAAGFRFRRWRCGGRTHAAAQRGRFRRHRIAAAPCSMAPAERDLSVTLFGKRLSTAGHRRPDRPCRPVLAGWRTLRPRAPRVPRAPPIA